MFVECESEPGAARRPNEAGKPAQDRERIFYDKWCAKNGMGTLEQRRLPALPRRIVDGE